MKVLKIVAIVIVFFAALAAIAFFWGKSVWEKITFGVPRILGLDFNGISATDLANIAFTGGQKEVNAIITMDVTNKNNFSIPFSSLKVRLFYNGETIAETSDAFAGKNSVPANGTLYATDTVKINLSGAVLQLAIDKVTNGKATLEYKIMVKVFSIPLPKSLQSYTLEI